MTEEEIKTLDKRYEAVGWSLWLIWIGLTGVIPGLPDGSGMFGTALLLLGLNVARYRRCIPVNHFSLILGLLALIDGGVHLLRNLFAFQIELEFFPVLMVIIGVIMMVRATERAFDQPDQYGGAIEKPKRHTREPVSAPEETDSALIPALADSGHTEILHRA